METPEEIIYFDKFLKDRQSEVRLKTHTSFTASFNSKNKCGKSKNNYFKMKKLQ